LLLEISVGVADPKFPKSILLQVGPFIYICPLLSLAGASPVKISCPLLLMVPEKEGLALEAPEVALIVKLVLSDD